MKNLVLFSICLVLALLSMTGGAYVSYRFPGSFLSVLLIWSAPAWLLLSLIFMVAGVVHAFHRLRKASSEERGREGDRDQGGTSPGR